MKKVLTSFGLAATLMVVSLGPTEVNAKEAEWESYRQNQQEYWNEYRKDQQEYWTAYREDQQVYWDNYRQDKQEEVVQKRSEKPVGEISGKAEQVQPRDQAGASENAESGQTPRPDPIDSYADHIQAAANFWTEVDEAVDQPHTRINRAITGQIDQRVNNRRPSQKSEPVNEMKNPLGPKVSKRDLPKGFHESLAFNQDRVENLEEVYQTPDLKVARGVLNVLNHIFN